MKTNSREIRVFISSTFQDMQPERDYLMNHVFPRLREEAAARGVRLTEVDLRWGITAEESESFKVIEICLDEIANSHPFFIGLLGDRYGWTPSRKELEAYGIPERYAWVANDLEQGMSITEIEMQYGVLRRDPSDLNAAFYLKEPSADSNVDIKLSRLKKIIENQDKWIHRRYNDVTELGEMVYEDFIGLLDTLFPSDEDSVSDVEKRRRAQWAIINDKCSDYVPIGTLDRTMSDLLESPRIKGIAIEGESGTGKSALAAHTLMKIAAEEPETLIVSRFSTANDIQYTPERVLENINEEICELCGLKVPEMASGKAREALEATLAALPSDRKIVIMLDAVDGYASDSTYEAGGTLWIPNTGPNVQLIISYIPENFQRPESFGAITVGTLSDDDLRLFITRYLSRYGKKLEKAQLNAIFRTSAITNTMVLTALLDDIRHYGRYDNLTEYISSYESDDNDGAILTHLLEEKEKTYGQENVIRILMLLYSSVEGLREDEIISILGITPLTWSTVKCGCKAFIANRNGLYTLSHNMVRNTVYSRVLNAEMDYDSPDYMSADTYYMQAILNYIDNLDKLEPRHYAEKVNALKDVGTEIEVFRFVSSDDYLISCYGNRRTANFISDWEWLRSSEEYEFSLTCYLAELGKKDDPSEADFLPLVEGMLFQIAFPRLMWVAGLCVTTLHDPGAATAILRALALAAERVDSIEADYYKSRIASMLTASLIGCRKYKEALMTALNALEYTAMEDRERHSVLNNVSEIYICLAEEHANDEDLSRKYYTAARSILEPLLGERIRTSGADDPEVAATRANLAIVMGALGEKEPALRFQQEALDTYRKAQGSKSEDLAIELHNLANTCIDLHEYSRAADAFRESRDIYNDIFGRVSKQWIAEQRGLIAVLLLDGRFNEARKECMLFFSTVPPEENMLDNILDTLRCVTFHRKEPLLSDFVNDTLAEWMPVIEQICYADGYRMPESVKNDLQRLIPEYANVLSEQGNPEEALRCLERNIAVQPDITECSTQELLIRLRLAMRYHDQRMPEKSVAMNLSIIENYQTGNARDAQDVYILALGNIVPPLIMLGEYDKAEHFSILVIEEREKRSDCDPAVLSSLKKQLDYIRYMKESGNSNDNRTDPHDEEAEETAAIIHSRECARLFIDGYDNYRRGIFGPAISLLSQAVKLMKECDEPVAALARAYKYMALSYEYSRRTQNAIDCYNTARRIAETGGEYGIAAEIIKDKAEMHWNAEEYDQAEKAYWDEMYLRAQARQLQTVSEAICFVNILAAMMRQQAEYESILSIAASALLIFPESVEGVEEQRKTFMNYAEECLRILDIRNYSPSAASIAGMADHCFRHGVHRPLAQIAEMFVPNNGWIASAPDTTAQVGRIYFENYIVLGQYYDALTFAYNLRELFREAGLTEMESIFLNKTYDDALMAMRLCEVSIEDYCSVYQKPEEGLLLTVWNAYSRYVAAHKADALHACEEILRRLSDDEVSDLERGQAAFDAAVLAKALGRKNLAEQLCTAGIAAIEDDYNLYYLTNSLNTLSGNENR